MIQLLMLLSLIPAGHNQVAKSDFEICQAPRRCAEAQAPVIAQVQPCVWPRTCGKAEARPAATVAQYRPCLWPNTCAKEQPAAPVVAQFQPCVWPKTCGRSDAAHI